MSILLHRAWERRLLNFEMVIGKIQLPTFNMREREGREVLDLLLENEAQGGQHGDAAVGDLCLAPAPDLIRAACAAQEVERIKDVCSTWRPIRTTAVETLRKVCAS